jgi:hypothetical protein
MNREEVERVARAVSKRLADEGRLIEAGWAIFRGMVVHPDAPTEQLDEMKLAFMAGAEHLFDSIITVLDPGNEPTDADLRRMELIHRELEAFRKTMEDRGVRPC